MGTEQTESTKPRVLVVEDDPVSATLIQRLFINQGVTVEHAPDGLMGLKMHTENPYRIVVSDWMMPELDGVSLCRAFREQPGPYVYFILCSAKHQREDRIEAYEAGVDDFLTKPLDRHEMQARLKVARRILSTEDALQQQNEALETTNTRLEIASERFQGLFSGLPNACFTFDTTGRIQEWNTAAHTIFGIEEERAIGNTVWDLLNDRQEQTWSSDLITRIFGGAEHHRFDWEFKSDNSTKYLACSIITIRDEVDGQKAICANLDITDRKLAEQQIEMQMRQINAYASQLGDQKLELERINNRLNHLAITDGLTGLWNHRKFQELLEQSVNEVGRTKKPFSLLLLDIDNFKRVNDELGHQAGDEVLQLFAEVLRQQSRSYELPARYGGEEFAIIVSCDIDAAIVAAERFREAIAGIEWQWPIRASFGVTTCEDGSSDAKTLIREADYALYSAKQRGKDQVVHYSSLSDEDRKSPVLLR